MKDSDDFKEGIIYHEKHENDEKKESFHSVPVSPFGQNRNRMGIRLFRSLSDFSWLYLSLTCQFQ